MRRRLVVTLMVAVAGVLALRVWSPTDLWDQDQPKTVAYTVDIVEHGRWVLPRDMLGRPTTKPPLYNWVGAPALALFGPGELVLKLPSVLAGLGALAVTVVMARRMASWLPRAEQQWAEGDVGALPGVGAAREVRWQIGLAAGVIWLACYPTVKLIYTARPDMVLAALLVAGWWLGTKLLEGPGARMGRRRRWALLVVAFWGCVAAAALTKGPPAVLPVLYVLIAARLRQGRWGAIGRTGIAWGLPLAVVLVSAWGWAAYEADPEHFTDKFVGYETVGRVLGWESLDDTDPGVTPDSFDEDEDAESARGGPLRIVTDLWKMPVWFLARFAPWSLFVLLALVHIPARRWATHALGPAIIWLLLVIGLFSLSAGKRADYLAPAYPAAAVLAAYWLIVVARKYRVTADRVTLAAMAVALAIAVVTVYQQTSPPPRERYGEHVDRFVRRVRTTVGADRVLFVDTGYTPIQPLLGDNRNVRIPPTDAERRAARWVIRPHRAGERPWVVSDTVLGGTGRTKQQLGLYQLVNGREIDLDGPLGAPRGDGDGE